MDTTPPVSPTPPPAPGDARHAPHRLWYRFTLLLAGDPTAAGHTFSEVMTAAGEQIAHFRSQQSRRLWLVRKIISRVAPGSGGDAQEQGRRGVAALPEPQRSAYALFLVFEGSTEELGELLDRRSAALTRQLAEARAQLAPSASLPRHSWLPLYRAWGINPPRVEKAVQQAGAEEKAALEAQGALDRGYREAAMSAELPAHLYFPEFADPARPGLRALIRQPAVVAILCALLVVVGVLVLTARHQINDFPGRQQVSELVEDSVGSDGVELEAIERTETGRLADWFLLKGFEGFGVPDDLERAVAIGGRIYHFKEAEIAQVALEKRDALLFVFRNEVRGKPPEEEQEDLAWHFFQHDDWAVAVRNVGSLYYVVTFQGDEEEMPRFLAEVARSEGLPEESSVPAQATPLSTSTPGAVPAVQEDAAPSDDASEGAESAAP